LFLESARIVSLLGRGAAVTRIRFCLLVVCLSVAGCQAGVPQPRVRLDDEAAVYLYVQPFPPEAERLRVVIDGVSARLRDGGEVPLSLALRELNSRDVPRQRLLAAGSLPAGDYAGFAFRTKSASLRAEEGESALLVAHADARIDFSLTVRRGEGYVVALALRYGESVEGGFRFTPVFSVYRPRRPAAGVMGFVVNSGSDDVTVFDKKTFHVFEVIATGRGPSGIALDQRARRVYVALSGDDGVEIVDVLAGRIHDRVRLSAGDEPVDLALTPEGKTLLSANKGSNAVSVIDPASRFEVARIPVGNGPRSILMDPTGRRAFVFNSLSNTVSVIDVASRAVIRSITTDPGPVRGAFNRRGDRLYVIHEIASYVTVINPTTLAVIGRSPIRSAMDAIEVDRSTDLVYLGARRELVVAVHDPLSFAPVDFIDTGSGIAQMATDSEDNTLYLVSPATNRVLVSERIRKRIIGEIDVGDNPSSISVMGEN
jgi:YVTN family beta-propeller protein